jgi:hypothetical protein
MRTGTGEQTALGPQKVSGKKKSGDHIGKIRMGKGKYFPFMRSAGLGFPTLGIHGIYEGKYLGHGLV